MVAPTRKRVVVIGGGPSGVVTLKTLVENGFDALLIEAEDSIGGTFLYRSYDNAELVSSKQLTCFSDYRYKSRKRQRNGLEEDHMSLPAYVDYLHDYIHYFGLLKGTAWDGGERLRLGHSVVSINKDPHTQQHIVRYTPTTKSSSLSSTCSNKELYCDAVAICTGLHVTPSMPTIPGFKDFIPESIHSSEYHGRHQLAGRRVCVLGCGETAMDIGYEAVQAGATEVVMCQRGGFLSFPKVLNDFRIFGYTFKGALPIDGLITNLFETAYVHPWVSASRLRWFVSDFVVKRVLWFLTGTSAGCNQWVGELPPERLGRAYVFLNKSSKAMPYINLPYKPKFRLLSILASYIDPPLTSSLSIEMAPFPTHATSDGRIMFTPSVLRKDYQRMKDKVIKPDLVVYCTGYKQCWDWLGEEYNTNGAGEANVRNIVNENEPSVAYIGFVRPGVGAIPPLSELQAMWWTLLLKGEMKLPTSPTHYKLLARQEARIQYGVDHSAYSSQLAKDMGAAPSLWQLYTQHGFHVLLCYCFGAAFVTFYRLTGPFQSSVAPEIVRTELWSTITRRGVLGNLFMGVIPMTFYGILSLIALMLEQYWIYIIKPLVGLLPNHTIQVQSKSRIAKTKKVVK